MTSLFDLKPHFNDYRKAVTAGLESVDNEDILNAYFLLQNMLKPWTHRRIFVCGNGGSASIAEHFSCDHSKGVRTNTNANPQVISLSSNMATLTAIANDIGYDQIFKKQLEYHSLNMGDLVVAISSSGNSHNIVEAVKYAHERKAGTISFVGFDGGMLKKIYDESCTIIVLHACLHVKSNNYGIVEDCHQALMHMLAQALRKIHTIEPIKVL